MPIEEKRRELLAAIPRWYSGYAHFVLINVVALLTIRLLLRGIDQATPGLWLFFVGFFVFANGFEWWIHRGPMHHRTRFLGLLYQRHTLEHHVVYTEQSMVIRDASELYYILFPWWFLPAILIANVPVAMVLGRVVSPDLGYLFYACILAYYLVYEWFHTIHHFPPESWIGRRSLVRWVRIHHRRHHDPALMARGNFNVSFPLWDHLLGSCLAPSPSETE